MDASNRRWITGAGLAAGALAGLGVFFWRRSARAAADQAPGPTDCPTKGRLEKWTGRWEDPEQIMTLEYFQSVYQSGEEQGDLSTNWGKTPEPLRPYFHFLETNSRIPGVGRVLSAIAYAVSDWDINFRLGSGDTSADRRAVEDSRREARELDVLNVRFYRQEDVANFGRGGIFGLTAPGALASGASEDVSFPPLRNECPGVLRFPAVSGFAACSRVKRLLALNLRDNLDLGVGWGDERLVTSPPAGRRGSAEYEDTRAHFTTLVSESGIDFSTIPRLDASNARGDYAMAQLLIGDYGPRWHWDHHTDADRRAWLVEDRAKNAA